MVWLKKTYHSECEYSFLVERVRSERHDEGQE